MKNIFKYIKSWMLVSTMVFAFSMGSAYAFDKVDLRTDTLQKDQASIGQLASIASRNKRNAKAILDENEKSITNVKVFYNPIAEQISVSFRLGKSGQVSVKVMDALGNEQMSLMNDHLDASIHTLSFDTNNNLPAGFYFVRVTSGNEAVIKRISIR